MTERIAAFRVEAETTRVLLPRCAHCRAPHPLATNEPDPARCPRCFRPAAPPGSPRVSASVVPRAVLPLRARLCLAVAAFLRRIERMLG